MKQSVVALALAALSAVAGTPTAITWQKFISANSFSFHYPAGWQVKEQESIVEVANPRTQEQLLILAMPFEKSRSPLELAQQMIGNFRQAMPDIEVSGFHENGPSSVYFQSTYAENGAKFRSEVMVIKDTASAHWLSYSAPADGYHQAYGLGLLQDMISTIAAGSASRPPTAAASAQVAAPAPLDKNARAFLFVLEFTLGAPLNQAQEQLILTELLNSWQSESPESLKKFDLYPQVVTAILGGGQHELEKLRGELEQSTREWLDESDPNDRVVRIVRTQLELRSRTLAAGNPPLPEMAATAYSELMTFAQLVSVNRNASPSSIPQPNIDSMRERLKNQWTALSAAEKEDVLSTPGLWITFRTLLQFGGASEMGKARSQLAKLAPAPSSSSSGKASPRPMSMVEHNVLMNVNQMTFNNYMWSRGFKSSMWGY